MRENFKKYVGLCIGALISALALDLFLAPNKIAPGGASGVGIILNSAFSVPVSVTVFSINAVLFYFARKRFCKRVLLMTLVSTALLAVFIQLFSFLKPLGDDMLLSAIFGGAAFGAGSGLTIACGASTGGTDFLAVILNDKFSNIKIADIIMFADLAVAIVSGAVFKDYSLFMYALLALYISTRVVDRVINGFNFARLVYVVSEKSEMLAEKIVNELDMGVTAIYGKGMYTGDNRLVLMCAMKRNDFPKFLNLVKTTDKNAFIILAEANEVLGEGFNK